MILVGHILYQGGCPCFQPQFCSLYYSDVTSLFKTPFASLALEYIQTLHCLPTEPPLMLILLLPTVILLICPTLCSESGPNFLPLYIHLYFLHLKCSSCLDLCLQWLECWPVHHKSWVWFQVKGTYLGCNTLLAQSRQ